MKIIDLSVDMPGYEERKASRITFEGTEETLVRNVIVEHILNIVVNEELVSRLVCTPKDLVALTIGHLLTEEVIRDVSEIETIHICERGETAKVFLNHPFEKKRQVSIIRTCNCSEAGILGREILSVDADRKKNKDSIPQREEIVQIGAKLIDSFSKGGPIHEKSGGTHSAYLYYHGEVKYEAEDIGRHNALDKVIGMAAMDSTPLQECFAFTSGRVPLDMIQKIVVSGIPVLFSNAVPTTLALKTAAEYGIGLYTTARKSGMDQIE